MRESMAGISIFQLVVLFILLFTGIMCLTINHAKAFGVKDEILNIIEETDVSKLRNYYELDDSVLKDIAETLSDAGYRTSGDCPDGNWLGYDRNGEATSGKASFCIRATNVTDSYNSDLQKTCQSNDCVAIEGGFPPMVYYDLALFYQLDVPLITEFNFRIYGSSKTLYG